MEKTNYLEDLQANGHENIIELKVFGHSITYGPDYTLRWNPPAHSREFALALSYHFPLEKDIESKMKAATAKLIRDETSGTSISSQNPISRGNFTSPVVEELGNDSSSMKHFIPDNLLGNVKK